MRKEIESYLIISEKNKMRNKTLKDFANWLGLQVGHKYKIGIDGRPFIVAKDYNLYYDNEGIGYSLYSFNLNDLLNKLIEII